MAQIGEKLRELRKKKKLSQVEFYGKIGVDQRTGSYWENKAEGLSAEAIHKICRTYGVTIENLLGEDSLSRGIPEMDLEEQRIMDAFRRLDKEKKLQLIEFAAFLIGDEAFSTCRLSRQVLDL